MPTENAAQTRRPLPFMIGADPEYNATSGGRRINAQQLVISLLSGKLEAGHMGYKVPERGNVGWDGNSATGEIRPLPSHRPEEVAANVGGLYAPLASTSPLLGISVKSLHAPVGGHVHFGILGMAGASDMQEVHRMLVSMYLPVLLGEDPVNNRLRSSGTYGKMNDFRTETTYEFRVPTAEWQVTERICRSTLAYLGVVMAEILERPDRVKASMSRLLSTVGQAAAVQELVSLRVPVATRDMLRTVAEAVRGFEYYPDYKDEVEFVLRPDRVLAEKRKHKFDVASGWGLRPKEKMTESNVLGDGPLRRAVERGADPERFMGVVPVVHNTEMRVAEFANVLREKCAAAGWELKRPYYLFGLRKGVKGIIAMDERMRVLAGAEQLRTEEDLSLLSAVFRRMHQKTADHGTSRKVTLLGLPYDMRLKRDHKAFLKTVWALEHGSGNPQEVKLEAGSADTEIRRAYANQPVETAAVTAETPDTTAAKEERAAAFVESEGTLSVDAQTMSAELGATPFKDDVYADNAEAVEALYKDLF